jgi:5-methylcytosine-specific restriction endonuclease McrA
MDQSDLLEIHCRAMSAPMLCRPRSAYKVNRDIVFALQGWLCACCCEKKPLTAHHILPRSRGGSDEIKNLLGLCRVCHDDLHNQREKRQRGANVIEFPVPRFIPGKLQEELAKLG